MANKMRAIHPGEILQGEMEELSLSANVLAQALGVPPNRITAILNGGNAHYCRYRPVFRSILWQHT